MHVKEHIVIDLAGHAAVCRERSPRPGGWVRVITTRQVDAFHEAGHVVAGAAVGLFPQWAIIGELRTSGGTVRGAAFITRLPEQDAGRPTLEGIIPSDFARATQLCQLMIGEQGWLAYMRSLWLQADAILEAHWEAVEVMAKELDRKGELDKAAIQDIFQAFHGDGPPSGPPD